MGKFSVNVGKKFPVEACDCGHSHESQVTVVMVNDGDPDSKPLGLSLVTNGVILVGVFLLASVASATAYGFATGDYESLKALPELIRQFLSAIISMMKKES